MEISWQRFLEIQSTFVGGDLEMQGYMLDGSKLRGRVARIEARGDKLVISFEWMANLRRDGWMLKEDENRPCMTLMTSCRLSCDEDGKLTWGFSEAFKVLFPRGHANNLDPRRVIGHPDYVSPMADTSHCSTTKRVVFYRGHPWGSITMEEPDHTIWVTREGLLSAMPAAEITIVETPDALVARLAQGGVSAVVFFSRAEIELARRTCEDHPILVLLLTGLMQSLESGRVILIEKGSGGFHEVVSRIIAEDNGPTT